MKRDMFEREVALPVLKEPALRVIRSNDTEEAMARRRPKSTTIEEPMGIVISRGVRDEPSPVVSAYVWGPAPESDAPETKAA